MQIRTPQWLKIVFTFTVALPLLLFLSYVDMGSQAEAAGEEIEFNDIVVPAATLTERRALPAGSSSYYMRNWYSSTMTVQIPAYTLTNVKYNKVTGVLTGSLSNYWATSWVVNREALGSHPKEEDYMTRWNHGYGNSITQAFQVYYADGTHQTPGGGSRGYTVPSIDSNINGNLSPFFDGTASLGPMSAKNEAGYYDQRVVPTFRVYLGTAKIPTGISILQQYTDVYWLAGNHMNYLEEYYPYSVTDNRIFPLTTNKAPTVVINSQPNQTVMNDAGFSTFNLEGYVQDVDNDTVDVIAEIPNVFYQKITLSNTASPKNFSIPIDVLTEGIPPGSYTVNVKVVDPFNFKAEAPASFAVTNRLRNKAFFLINSPVDVSTAYSDYENDGKYAERYRYDQDPSLFDNSMGMIADSGLWRNSRYSSFPYTGAYTAIFQARDNPDADDRLDPYRLWSMDNLSSMTFMIHRKPVALFSARLVNGSLQLADSSYDIDHTTSPAKGLITWQWQWRKAGIEVWTEGQPPAQLPTADPYEIRLRVRDIDGVNGIGVWSDWMQQIIGSPSNLPPVALFTVDPMNVSYRQLAAITDKSFDPDNDPLDIYSWSVVKDGWNTVWSSWGGAVVPPNVALFGVGSYQINLQVHDNRGLWSGVYSQTVQVINHPPAASFTMPNEVYRDTVITPANLTPDPDEDGDSLQYAWYTRLNSDPYNWTRSTRNLSFTIRDVIAGYGLTNKKAISDGWEMRLNVSDGSLTSYATQLFTVKNHVPAAAISGPDVVYQYDTRNFASDDIDEDSADQGSLQYYWRVTGSDNKISMFQTPGISLTFNELGTYTLEHWVVDQIGDKSNIASVKVSVTENLPPSMTLTAPAGTLAAPAIIDASKEGDPLIKWTYADPESDPQESYRLEFFSKDGLLAKTTENNDSTGTLRQYQLPNPTLERFLLYTVQGRVFSKRSWSDYSNEQAFIIDNPPQPGFTLMTDTGRDAALEPIHRTDVLQVESTATDPDVPQGDELSYSYYLKPSRGTEMLANTLSTFTKQFTTNGTFTLRQVVTDTLGLYRELSQSITVVNRIPAAEITYPTSTSPSSPTIVSTLTPILKWDYRDEDGDMQQRFRVRIINLASGAVKIQSGEQVSGAHQWQVPAGALTENEKYAVEVEVYDGFDWSNIAPRKYMMVNLLSIKGAVRHTEEWNSNRQAYNLDKSGDAETPRGYNVYWAGEKFVLLGTATGLPDTVLVTMTGGYETQLISAGSDRTIWTGELYDSSFENLPDGPVTFTFTATNEYNTKVDTVTVVIQGEWTEYFQNHRVK